MWARGRCRISPPRFLAECCKRQLNQGSFLLLYLRLICTEFVYLYFPVLFCLSVAVKRLAAKTASEMTYIVLSGALNSTPTNTLLLLFVYTVLTFCSPEIFPAFFQPVFLWFFLHIPICFCQCCFQIYWFPVSSLTTLCGIYQYYYIFPGVEKPILNDIGSDIFFSNETASLSSSAASSDVQSVRNKVLQQNDSDSDWDDMHGI